MPSKKLFTKEAFIEAAFRIVRARGWEALSARSLAEEIECSTMPIYSYLKSMKNLKKELRKKALDLLLSYQTPARTHRVFFDMGLGYVLFARREKHLFRFLFLRNEPGDQKYNTGSPLREMALTELTQKMKKDPIFKGLDERTLRKILTKMWVFVHGLAFLSNNGVFVKNDEAAIQTILEETGEFIIRGEISKKERENASLHQRKEGK